MSDGVEDASARRNDLEAAEDEVLKTLAMLTMTIAGKRRAIKARGVC